MPSSMHAKMTCGSVYCLPTLLALGRCCCPCCHQINKYAFSGGGATLEEHRANGANLDVDVPWKYLNFFMEDDAKLATIGREYGAGRMLTGERTLGQCALVLRCLVLRCWARG
jgi:hypothetical protein